MNLALDFSFYNWDLISNFVLKGLYFSLMLTLVATIGGVLFGTVLALMRLSGKSLGMDCAEVWLKLEHLQVSGSFKARGMLNRLLAQPIPASGVIVASGGNAGIATAAAALTWSLLEYWTRGHASLLGAASGAVSGAVSAVAGPAPHVAVVDHDDGPYRGAVARPEADHRPDAVTLLVAHGSRNARATADHTALCNAVADESGRTVRPAFLEISEPSIGDAVDAAVRDGARVVIVVPLFVHAGPLALAVVLGGVGITYLWSLGSPVYYGTKIEWRVLWPPLQTAVFSILALVLTATVYPVIHTRRLETVEVLRST